ncbi:histidinol phosphate aminotransferase [Antarctobacter sp.]|uniref:histidinol phosphate aminotransferase n=1 Tax=Antarctobacter sp. TaxID=1872577 RepID=UPI002B268CF3|nr:histidinol phosphate aminotransferase [Antarctobacter sp.]
MENHHPKPVENYMTANMILIFVNLMWVFVALWSYWGLGVVLILAALLNRLITRIDMARRRRDAKFDGI